LCRSFLDEGKVLQIKSAHDQEALGEESGDVMGHVFEKDIAVDSLY